MWWLTKKINAFCSHHLALHYPVCYLITDASITNPTYSAGTAVYDDIIMEPNPSYNVSIPSEPSNNPAYSVVQLPPSIANVTKPKEDEKNHEYEDIINIQPVKITRNPSYSAP